MLTHTFFFPSFFFKEKKWKGIGLHITAHLLFYQEVPFSKPHTCPLSRTQTHARKHTHESVYKHALTISPMKAFWRGGHVAAGESGAAGGGGGGGGQRLLVEGSLTRAPPSQARLCDWFWTKIKVSIWADYGEHLTRNEKDESVLMRREYGRTELHSSSLMWFSVSE